MLKNRIISTLRFFDLQDYPPTLLELTNFLISDWACLSRSLDRHGELNAAEEAAEPEPKISCGQIRECLAGECAAEVQSSLGFYYLSGRQDLAPKRLENYFYGIRREKLIRRHVRGLKYLPFIRGAALAGSQALGQSKETSDIDLLIIVSPRFLWLGRTFATVYFQVLGKRRHGQKITNRFCLNHYLTGPKRITELRNLYTAAEYLKLRPLVYAHNIWAFQTTNSQWLARFFGNAELLEPSLKRPSRPQEFLEKVFSGQFGSWLERTLKNWQLSKIRQEKFIVVENDELSFHPQSKQQQLLSDFVKLQQQQQRIAVKLVG